MGKENTFKKILVLIAAQVAFVAFVFILTPLVIRQADIENEWRKDRLCRIYEVCENE